MTTLEQAARQALEALEEYQNKGAPFMSCDAAVEALRKALEQPVREWVGLTDEEIDEYCKLSAWPECFEHGALWAKEKLKEKNA